MLKLRFVLFDAFVRLIRIFYFARQLYSYQAKAGVCGKNPGENTMIFRQLFDESSSTYTYLLAERQGGEALLIDP